MQAGLLAPSTLLRQPPLIFRDLKPANVMRTSDGHVYLIDFGIARHFQPGKAKDTIPLGSQGYAAPEQYGKAQTTPQTDIYGLGALLHQLVTGHDPSLTPFRFAPVRVRQSPVSSQLDALLKEMLAMEMSKRPASMTVVREHLQRLLAQQTAKQLSPLQQSQSPLIKRRNFGCWIASGLFVLISMRVINQELQHIATHGVTSKPVKKPRLSRRALLGNLASLSIAGGFGALIGFWQLRPLPRPDYSPGLGRTIYMYHPTWTQPGSLSYTNIESNITEVLSAAWSPNGKYIAVACTNNAAYILNVSTGDTALTYTHHSKPVEIVAWSPLGHVVASGSDDGTVRIWNAR